MFQFRRFPSYTYGFSIWYLGMNLSGLLHSEIHGSMLICSSPWLIAAYHVFLRLLVPRHSPCALCSLTNYACSHDLIVVFVTLAFCNCNLYSHSQFHISLFNFQGTQMNKVHLANNLFGQNHDRNFASQRPIIWGFILFSRYLPFFKVRLTRALKIEQHWKLSSLADRIMIPKNHVSIERRWSSRTFRYGYLVTTSPQSSPPP